jgi:hypothetical protein
MVEGVRNTARATRWACAVASTAADSIEIKPGIRENVINKSPFNESSVGVEIILAFQGNS